VIAQCYSAGLWAGLSEVRVPVGTGNFSLHHRVQTGSGAHPASYAVGTRGSFSGGKAAEPWSWPLTSIWYRGQEYVELYLHSPIQPSWCDAQLKPQNQVYLYLLHTRTGHWTLQFAICLVAETQFPTRPVPKPTLSHFHPPPVLKIRLSVILPFSQYFKWTTSKSFPHQNSVCILRPFNPSCMSSPSFPPLYQRSNNTK
jgi:hypothetical protein